MSAVGVRSDEITWQQIDDAIVVLDQARATYLRIAGAGLLLWPLIAEGTDVATMADRLVTEFGIDATTATADVEEFVESLRAQDLLAPQADAG